MASVNYGKRRPTRELRARGGWGFPAQLAPTWKRYGLGMAVDMARTRHDCGAAAGRVREACASIEDAVEGRIENESTCAG